MLNIIELYDDDNNTNIIGDFSLHDKKFFYINTTKIPVELHKIIIFIKIKKKLRKTSYGGNNKKLNNGFNFYYTDKNKTQIPLLHENNIIFQNNDLFKNGFKLDMLNLDILRENMDNIFYIYKWEKILVKPIILNKNESFSCILSDDFSDFIEHKILVELY